MEEKKVHKNSPEHGNTGDVPSVRKKKSGLNSKIKRKNTKSKAAFRRSRWEAIKTIPRSYLIAGASVIALIILVFCIRGCGKINLKTPVDTARTYISAAVKGENKKIRKCYGLEKDIPESIQTEIDTAVTYYAAHNPGDVNILASDILFDDGDYSFVYIRFNLILADAQEYPCITTLLTKKTEGNSYIVASSEITGEQSKQAQESYVKFMTTDLYKTYLTEYEAFIKRNPNYEESISDKIAEVDAE